MKNKRIYKTCSCCDQLKSEDNFRRVKRDKGKSSDRINWTSSICKLCEKQCLPSKEAKLQKIKERVAKINANTEKRLKQNHLKSLELDDWQ